MRDTSKSLRLGLLAAAALCGSVRADGPTSTPAPAPAAKLLDLGLNDRGAESWFRERDGAVVVRVPKGDYARRPYEGGPASEAPRPYPVASFLIDEHEVTNEQFARFLNALPPETANVDRLVSRSVPGIVRGPDGRWSAAPGLDRHPVTAATGHGALAYAAWAGARLPTQAEWEKAAGGSEGRLYPWGDEPPDASRANFGRPKPRGTMPVGSFPLGASPYGCLDMAGNAYDRVVPDGGGRRADAPDAPMPARSALPVMVKGGAWVSHHPLNLRVLDLCMQSMDVADRSVGFRCAMDDPEPDRPTRAPEPRPVLRLARDFDKAVQEARERRVPIFLSLLYDTCGQCDRTREQAYRDPRFIAYCNEHLVVVIGHDPGDAFGDEHPMNEDGTCPLYPGLTCAQHEMLFVRGLEVVGEFRVSPGNFLLHPDKVRKGAGKDAILVGEGELPKWGADVDAYLAAFEKARAALAR